MNKLTTLVLPHTDVVIMKGHEIFDVFQRRNFYFNYVFVVLHCNKNANTQIIDLRHISRTCFSEVGELSSDPINLDLG